MTHAHTKAAQRDHHDQAFLAILPFAGAIIGALSLATVAWLS